MKLSINFFLILSLFTSSLIAQNLNDYKYIIIPNKYDFLDNNDQYKLNSLTKFLFEKEQFTAIYKDDKTPIDLSKNPCLGLNLDLIKKSSFFYTELQIELKNCRNEIIFTSKKGKSKLKEYKRAYHEALRSAFQSVKNLNYNPKIIAKANISIEKENTKQNIADNTYLYAKKIKNGYKLINNKSEVKYTLLKSGKEDVYLLKNKKGIIYLDDKIWIKEIYFENKSVTTELKIKF